MPPDNRNKLGPQTAASIGEQPNLLPVMFSPEHILEAAVNTLNAAVFYLKQLFWCVTTACAPLG